MSDSDWGGQPQSAAGDSEWGGVSDEGSPARCVVERRVRNLGTLTVFLIVACAGALLGTWKPPAGFAVDHPDEARLVVGAVVGRWCLVPSLPDSDDRFSNLLFERATQEARHTVLGYIVYERLQSIILQCPERLIQGILPHHLADTLGNLLAVPSGDVAAGEVRAVSDWFRIWGEQLKPVGYHISLFTPWVAHQVVCSTGKYFYCRAVSERMRRSKLLTSHPGKKTFKLFKSLAVGLVRAPAAPPAKRLKELASMIPADLVIDWVRASLYIKNIKKADEACDAFARILARSGLQTRAELMCGLQRVNREVLRRARVRVDCCDMLLWREFFRTLDLSTLDIFIFVDGSPQYRGLEMFATTLDLFISGSIPFHVRLLLPVIALRRDFLDQTGKTVGLLWQLFLVAGSLLLQPLLFRVRAILSDNGVERQRLRVS